MSDENVKDSPSDTGEPVETAEQESFATMLEKSGDLSGRLDPGQKVKAKVITISGDLVYIDLGGKSEGVIDLSEFKTEDGATKVHPGDEIEAFFVHIQDGVRKLTTLMHGYSALQLNAMYNAYEAGIPVRGEVKREVKGGFEIAAGGVRCFCPFSQIDLKGGREGGVYLGQTFPFKILEYKDEGRNVILSRRALLEEEQRARIERLKETLSVGMEVAGTVRSIQNFGAFVDLGGADALIPVSEIAWGRTEKTGDVLSIGQEVKAKILSLDWHKNRLTLSLRAMQPDPWAMVAEKYPIDSKVSGTIVRLAPFGAFVSLEPGVDGLIHISNLGAGRRINHPKEVVEVGQWVEAYVLGTDAQQRKISLSVQPRPKPEKLVLPSEGELIDGVVEKVMPFGIFLKLHGSMTGLIPNSEMGTPRGTDHSRMFPEGTAMRVVVVEVDAEKGKVSLSRKGVMQREEEEEFNRYRDSVNKEGRSSPLGSFGEILKAKLEEKKRAR
jgi:small subunit ribosomal protein S1